MDETQKLAIVEKIQELKNLIIFYTMDNREVFEVMKRCDFLNFAVGETVFKEGDQSDCLYVIVKGEFEVTAEAASGDPVRFFCAGQGLIFGEMSFLDTRPRSATIVATQDSEVLCFTRSDYDHLLVADPSSAAKFMMGIAEILSRRLRGANQRIKFTT